MVCFCGRSIMDRVTVNVSFKLSIEHINYEGSSKQTMVIDLAFHSFLLIYLHNTDHILAWMSICSNDIKHWLLSTANTFPKDVLETKTNLTFLAQTIWQMLGCFHGTLCFVVIFSQDTFVIEILNFNQFFQVK